MHENKSYSRDSDAFQRGASNLIHYLTEKTSLDDKTLRGIKSGSNYRKRVRESAIEQVQILAVLLKEHNIIEWDDKSELRMTKSFRKDWEHRHELWKSLPMLNEAEYNFYDGAEVDGAYSPPATPNPSDQEDENWRSFFEKPTDKSPLKAASTQQTDDFAFSISDDLFVPAERQSTITKRKSELDIAIRTNKRAKATDFIVQRFDKKVPSDSNDTSLQVCENFKALVMHPGVNGSIGDV
jgi:hypothetical protein